MSSMVLPRPPPPSCFSLSRGTPDDPAREARRGPASLRLPRDDDALELVESERNQKADDRDHEQADIHLLDRERAPGAPDQVAEPALGADHLGDRDQHQPDADAELESG